MLVDIVSKNGNLLINVVQTPEGDLEPDMLEILNGIGKWTAVNGEGIYGSRPWKIYGEKSTDTPKVKSGNFNEGHVKYDARDIRFTTKGNILYAFCLAKPTTDVKIISLGKNSKYSQKTIVSIKLLGSKEKLAWRQEANSLIINKPVHLPDWQVVGFRIQFKN
jgi:alpha-L-fucosidase